jgi:hypothetical protein
MNLADFDTRHHSFGGLHAVTYRRRAPWWRRVLRQLCRRAATCRPFQQKENG